MVWTNQKRHRYVAVWLRLGTLGAEWFIFAAVYV